LIIIQSFVAENLINGKQNWLIVTV